MDPFEHPVIDQVMCLWYKDALENSEILVNLLEKVNAEERAECHQLRRDLTTIQEMHENMEETARVLEEMITAMLGSVYGELRTDMIDVVNTVARENNFTFDLNDFLFTEDEMDSVVSLIDLSESPIEAEDDDMFL